MSSGHTFCVLKDVLTHSNGTELWSAGHVKLFDLVASRLTLHHKGAEVVIDISLLEPQIFSYGVPYMVLGHVEKSGLSAKVLVRADDLMLEEFIEAALVNQDKQATSLM